MRCVRCNDKPACEKATAWPDRCFDCRPAPGVCCHCLRRKACKPRGLCVPCFRDRAVRALYPPTSKFAPKGEPTEAELDAIIAEQMQCLPDWWESEKAQARAGWGDDERRAG